MTATASAKISKAPRPSERGPILTRTRNLKMARSAHAYVRGSTVQFYEWLEASGGKLPKGPPIWICGDCHLGNMGPLEAAAARLAGALGLDVSIPEAIVIDGVEALLITRFDRVVREGVVYRLHQEDFAQALGLPARLKYERNGTPGRRFDAEAIARVLDQTEVPARARAAFLSATVFNLLIGNTDNHAKNHGLLYRHGRAPVLAPLYDLLPSRMNLDFNGQLSFNIGAADHPEAITLADLMAFLEIFGMRRAAASRFIENVVKPMILALERATLGLSGERLKDMDDLIGRETEQLVEVLGLDVPVRERDYFPKSRHVLVAS